MAAPCPRLQPEAPAGSDVHAGVQQLIADAQRLPEMPAWVDYRPLLADIAQWVEALHAAQADVAAAQQAAGQQAADSAAQFAAADEAADPESWHRLSWLSQQHPLVESRLGEVEGRVAPHAGTALAALQELAQRIQSSKVGLLSCLFAGWMSTMQLLQTWNVCMPHQTVCGVGVVSLLPARPLLPAAAAGGGRGSS